jgi:hypothetical protein
MDRAGIVAADAVGKQAMRLRIHKTLPIFREGEETRPPAFISKRMFDESARPVERIVVFNRRIDSECVVDGADQVVRMDTACLRPGAVMTVPSLPSVHR